MEKIRAALDQIACETNFAERQALDLRDAMIECDESELSDDQADALYGVIRAIRQLRAELTEATYRLGSNG